MTGLIRPSGLSLAGPAVAGSSRSARLLRAGWESLPLGGSFFHPVNPVHLSKIPFSQRNWGEGALGVPGKENRAPFRR